MDCLCRSGEQFRGKAAPLFCDASQSDIATVSWSDPDQAGSFYRVIGRSVRFREAHYLCIF